MRQPFLRRLTFPSLREQREAQNALYGTPMNEAGYAAHKTAANWGGSISPAMAQSIADAVLKSAGIEPKVPTTTYKDFAFGGGVKAPTLEQK